MPETLINIFSRLNPAALTGPIFNKELRVSSRRRRNYLLRFAYIALLTLFVVLVWLGQTQFYRNRSIIYQVSRLAEVGKTVVLTIVWFQFCFTQLVAVIMLSNSISDEIYHKTLGTLMTTPINALQIVLGKLLSKLLQIILLIALSLPLLAVVRVFGGIPWDFIVSSLCINLTTVIFVASISMFFSIFTRHSYLVIIFTVLTMAVLFLLLPFIAGLICFLCFSLSNGNTFFSAVYFFNPYITQMAETASLMSARGTPFTYSWPMHCFVSLAGSAVVLFFCVKMVRKAALAQAAGIPIFTPRKKTSKSAQASDCPENPSHTAQLRTVTGSAILWKELKRPPYFRRAKILKLLVFIFALAILAFTYIALAIGNDLDASDVQITYVLIMMALALLFTITLPATCITTEKESRSWPVLLGTTLSDNQILFGKFLGQIRRCLPAWILMFAHILLFIPLGIIHPIALPMMIIISTWTIIFFCSSGIYFSARFKHTTTAVIMNFALGIFLWFLIPFVLLLLSEAFNLLNDDFAESYLNCIPFIQAAVVIEGACRSKLSFYWPNFWNGTLPSLSLLLAFFVGYSALAAAFLWRAKNLFRKKIF